MTEKLKPCPFCKEADGIFVTTHDEIEERKATGCFAVVCCRQFGGCGASSGYYITKYEAITAWNTRAIDENPPLTLILPARVGDSIVVKDGDSTDTLRIDGFELRGDELMVWGEGDNERYVAFAPDEIIKYIPKEEVN